jgi:hypothetical protein
VAAVIVVRKVLDLGGYNCPRDFAGDTVGALAVLRMVGSAWLGRHLTLWRIRWSCCGTEEEMTHARLLSWFRGPGPKQCPACRREKARARLSAYNKTVAAERAALKTQAPPPVEEVPAAPVAVQVPAPLSVRELNAQRMRLAHRARMGEPVAPSEWGGALAAAVAPDAVDHG